MTSDLIIKVVADAFGYLPQTLRSERRDRRVVQARWVAMYAMRHLLGHSSSHIARELGKKDHTTVLYGLAQIERSTDESVIALRTRVMDIASTRPDAGDDVDLCVHRVTEQLGALAGIS